MSRAGNRPPAHRPSVTAGLKWPPEMWPIGIGHRQDGQAERERDAGEADAETGKRRGENGAAAAAEDEPERADAFGDSFCIRDMGIVAPRKYASATSRAHHAQAARLAAAERKLHDRRQNHQSIKTPNWRGKHAEIPATPQYMWRAIREVQAGK